MFTVYHSNQLDVLKDLLATLMVRAPLHDPLAQEVILVQSPGMTQWLQIQLAESLGIAANITFPLPATFIWELFTRLIADVPADNPFTKERMTWKLFTLLPQQNIEPSDALLQRYLQAGKEDAVRKRYQLAQCIADIYDQYLVYRPEWLLAWEQGKTIDGLDEHQLWQGSLWRALIAHTQHLGQSIWHRASLYQHCLQRLQQSEHISGLPQRIFVCGISALPVAHLQILQALGKHCDVHLMFTNPCRFYWGDIQDFPTINTIEFSHMTSHASTTSPAPSSFFDNNSELTSQPLLASWGKQGRDNLYFLAQLEGVQEIDAFVEVPSDSLLHRIQGDILELRNSAQPGISAATYLSSQQKKIVQREDRSLQIHVCHSEQREVEVLHDQLLMLFEADPQLRLRDIIVMVAEIDTYTPYIQSVFGNAPTERYLPFTIADRRIKQTHPALQAFIQLLGSPESRFDTEMMIALLDVPTIAARFSFDEQQLVILRQWIEETGICWGLDVEHVAELELPADGKHTWQFGLTRLLLGYAMDSQRGDWQGVLPYDDSSGLMGELVGRLADFLQCIRQWRSILQQDRTVEAWLPLGRELIEAFFVYDRESEEILTYLEQQWQTILQEAQAAQYSDPVSWVILRDELSGRLEKQRMSQHFLMGAINFCTFMPMRAIPFKVVCLLGMNEGKYPRIVAPMGFDLIAQQPRRGDRSRRDDDRYLFLEALQSAQQSLYISYIGRHIQDNSECYPSVLVSELIEYISQSHCLDGDERLDVDSSAQAVVQHLLYHHSRMPFDPANYSANSEYQSYASEWLTVIAGKTVPDTAFIQPLSPSICQKVLLDEWVRFFTHPIKQFFQQRLGVYFDINERQLAIDEPFTLAGLPRYHVRQHLVESLLQGNDPRQNFRVLNATGILPYGALGELDWQQQQVTVQELVEQLKKVVLPQHKTELSLTIAGISLMGWLNNIQQDGIVQWRPTELKVKHGIKLWLEHLAYCAMGGQHASRLYGLKKNVWGFNPLPKETAREYLAEWLQAYQQGMQTPLLLLPKTGWAWLEKSIDLQTGTLTIDKAKREQAYQRLLTVFQGNKNRPGEGSDPYIQRLIPRLDDSVVEQIMQTAQRYLLPLLQHRQAYHASQDSTIT